MSKIIFFFAGTGDDGENYCSSKESEHGFEDDVIRVYIKGCHHERVGNGFVFPDLDIAANSIRNAFVGNQLDLNQLRNNFAGGLYGIAGGNAEQVVTIDQIALEGFSRGAVTAYATAKKLDDLNIPLDIIANQPVPGETSLSRALVTKYSDLRHCRNVRSAITFLATYHMDNGLIQNNFFSQMMAHFSPNTTVANYFIPHQQHLEWFNNSPIPNHINKQLSKFGYTQSKNDHGLILDWYKNNPGHYFTPPEFRQFIHNEDDSIMKDPMFLKHVLAQAKLYLIKEKIEHTRLTPEQAAAILSLANQFSTSKETLNTLLALALENSPRGKKFITIVNKVSDVCEYLGDVTQDYTSNKSVLIRQHAVDYKQSVFVLSHQFLMRDTPTKHDHKQFEKDIYYAECIFRKQALGIERGTMRLVLKFLTNFITHITIIGLVANCINKAQTGNWLFFQHNRSVNAVRNTKKELLQLVKENREEETEDTSDDASLLKGLKKSD